MFAYSPGTQDRHYISNPFFDMTESKRVSMAGLLVAIVAALISAAALLMTTAQDIGSLSQRGDDHNERLQRLEAIDFSSQRKALDEQAALHIGSMEEQASSLQNFLPAGTILCSVLEPALFLADGRESTWMLADGSSVPPGSVYSSTVSTAKLISSTEDIPDLRGVFLRGVSGTRSDKYMDPDGNRSAGHVQDFMVGPHRHQFSDFFGYENGFNAGNTSEIQHGNSHHKTRNAWTQPHETAESRPNNVAVFFYIKVN